MPRPKIVPIDQQSEEYTPTSGMSDEIRALYLELLQETRHGGGQ